MKREDSIQALEDASTVWDVLVIGGGATVLSTAVDAAARGYRTALVEQDDFAKGTSSRSTKLIHGGFRYLKQGNVSLVMESLHERGLLLRNAPHLVKPLSFVVPAYRWWEAPYYMAGLKLYDALAGRLGIAPSDLLSRDETIEQIPTIEPHRLNGGVQYFDGQFDDSRLAICLAQTLTDLGGAPANYVRAESFLKTNGRIAGVVARDLETDKEVSLRAKVTINATGIFTDQVRQMDEAEASGMMMTSQGVHIVLDRSFLPGDSTIMIPKTDDGRILFAIPWQGRTVIGTTDTPLPKPELEPRALPDEIEFLVEHAARYLTKDPTDSDVLSVYAGLRPLVKAGDGQDTSKLSRNHRIVVSDWGLVTITGGKWTTCRKMGEDTIDRAAKVGGLQPRPEATRELKLHGAAGAEDQDANWPGYGSDAGGLEDLIRKKPEWNERLHPNLPVRAAEVVWAVRHEMARDLEDILSRRTRALLLDTKASVEIASAVAEIAAKELKQKAAWRKAQIESFLELARNYTIGRVA
jgi:glycerol-3-phosphate dehydrogenase